VNNHEYRILASVTDIMDYKPVLARLTPTRTLMVMHAIMGVVTEAGELQDQLKKHLIYGKPLDIVNLKEEDGDLRWYLALLETAIDADTDDILETNIAKLKARFPNKFNEVDALTRDLDRERLILEGFQKPLTKKWDRQINAWKFSCGCYQYQDGYELCDQHKLGGYKSLLDQFEKDQKIQKRMPEAAE
jgi:NTP pyrophosphatase (non-canonical NTP hydrolase)